MCDANDMTLEEKASLLSGKDNWHTKAVDRVGVPSIMMTDGPHGVRKMNEGEYGINSKIKTTCFPTASCAACSFDTELANKMAKAIALEAKANNVAVVLGPGANIKRSPLCGRNFEYYSEDPCLSGNMAGNFILGMNEENVGCSLKHFAANNQEYRRFIESNNIDMRALMDIYLKSFKIAMDISKPATIMCAYNKINEVYCSENKWLLTDILREKFGFDGLVMSDWGAVNNRVKAVEAGLDLEMPSCNGVTDKQVVKAVQNGELEEKYFDKAVQNVMNLVDKYKYINDIRVCFDEKEHYALAKEIAENSAVLMKNEDNVLPLKAEEKVLVVGDMAKISRFQGGGSSHITPFFETSLTDGLDKLGVQYDYLDGYHKKYNNDNSDLIEKIKKVAANYDKIVLCVGLPDNMEVEGLDRKHINLPVMHDKLVSGIASIHKKVVVVLFTGSCVELPWRNEVSGLLNMYLAGSGSGEACANILYGKVNPSGRLAESYPIKLEDCNSFNNFYYDSDRTYYSDSIYVGYRYYDISNTKVAYPFGYGLSYTTFEYSDIELEDDFDIEKGGKLNITIKNTGNTDGKEVVQVYIGKKDSKYLRPIKELKAFTKISVKANESASVTIVLNRHNFEIYDINLQDYVVESGEYQIYICKNSEEIIKTLSINVISKDKCVGDDREMLAYKPKDNSFPIQEFEKIYGEKTIESRKVAKKGEFTEYNCLSEIAEYSLTARFILFCIRNIIPLATGEGKDTGGFMMSYEQMRSNPLFKLGQSSGGALNEQKIQGIVDIFNGHLFRGISKMTKANNKNKS